MAARSLEFSSVILGSSPSPPRVLPPLERSTAPVHAGPSAADSASTRTVDALCHSPGRLSSVAPASPLVCEHFLEGCELAHEFLVGGFVALPLHSEVAGEPEDLRLVELLDLRHHQLVVGVAAVLEQDGERAPQVSQQEVLVVRVL